MNNAQLLPHFLIKTRAASAAKQNSQHVEQRNISVTDVRDVPREVHMTEFDGGFLDDFTRGSLAWLRGQNHWWQRAGFCLRVSLADLCDRVIVLHVTGDHIENIVGRVTLRVVAANVLGFEFVEDV